MADAANKPGLTGHLNIDLEKRVTIIEETPAPSSGGGLLDTTHNPIGLYQFQQDFLDSSGNSRDLTEVGTPDYGVGHVGGVVSWINVDERGEITGAAADPFRITGAITIECLLLPSTLTGAQTIAIFREDAAGDANNRLWDFQSSGNQIRWGHESSEGVFPEVTAGRMILGAWVHVAVTRNTAGTLLKIYFNGIEVGSATVAAATGGGSSNLYIGEFGPAGQTPFLGGIASLKIIASELTAAQVLAESKLALGGV